VTVRSYDDDVSDTFTFGAFELDVAAFSLRRAGERLKLEKIPMEVLILLVSRRGTLVGRTEITESLWDPCVFVEHDSAINTAIRKIRQALDDDADMPRFVETVVGKGYRFIASVTRRSPSSSPRGVGLASHSVFRGKQEFILEDGDNLLGRDPGAQVCVDHPSVSRQHAKIVLRSGRATLEDLQSRNGTFVNGRRLDAPTQLGHAAVIGLGPITLTFVSRSASRSTQPMGKAAPRKSGRSAS
jgi:DNA-binding winged helix-turn-helix (wHTH) protein